MNISDVDLPSNRKFGYTFSIIFLLAGIFFGYKGYSVLSVGLLLLAIIFLGISVKKPDVLKPLNKLWMRLGLLLGLIISPIVIGLIYFLIFTPMGVTMRIFGRDELRLKPRTSQSYWKIRSTDKTTYGSFKNQF